MKVKLLGITGILRSHGSCAFDVSYYDQDCRGQRCCTELTSGNTAWRLT
jgi:hypothetical protein